MKQKSYKDLFSAMKPVVALTVICSCVAAVLVGVNMLTSAKIEENLDAAERAAVCEVFGDEAAVPEKIEGAPDTVNKVCRVTKDGQLLGWSVSVSPDGFGGSIDMVVGIGTDGRITGVAITSLSETPGLGSRVAEKSYLEGYDGKSGKLVLKKDVDAISGATISSRSVLAGVNAALSAAEQMGLAKGGDAQ